MEPLFEHTTERGMPVSPARHAEVAAQLDAELAALEAQMQVLVPDELKPLKVCKKKPSYRLLFKPSTPQLTKYMRARNHPVPVHWKRKTETTEQDELKRLAKRTKDPLYQVVLDYRDARTLRSNHLHNWRPGSDGRVHPTFYYTSTGQMEARRPNTMNAPHHKPAMGDLFRSVVQAGPGKTLLSFDYKSFHALYLAWESQDRVMERMARIDLVSFATAHFLRLPHADEAFSWPDDQLREWLAGVKRDHRHIRDAKMKHAFHGYDNGMRARGCFMRYRDFFDSEKEVKRCIDVLDSAFCVAKRWREALVEQAHEQGYLISRFGTIRYFWEVKRFAGPDQWTHGDDAEAAASFIQQTCAHCHLKDAMLRLDAAGWLAKAGLCTPIHDDLTFECADELADEAVAYIRREMEAKNPTSGLNVKVEVKRGQAWNKMITLGEEI
jgi:DNA polymerase I-like protein with 3'-5' exonuclease and polymerase domains